MKWNSTVKKSDVFSCIRTSPATYSRILQTIQQNGNYGQLDAKVGGHSAHESWVMSRHGCIVSRLMNHESSTTRRTLRDERRYVARTQNPLDNLNWAGWSSNKIIQKQWCSVKYPATNQELVVGESQLATSVYQSLWNRDDWYTKDEWELDFQFGFR